MKLEQSFKVAAPVGQVWEALVDVERIAPCLPGAEITGRDDSGAYTGTFTVKLGPTTASYRGSLKMESLDADQHMATMSARGSDKRGQGGASATIVSKLHEEGGETHVDVDTDFTITGRLARFGRGGMIEDISRRLMREFAACLQTALGESSEANGAEAAAAQNAGAAEAGGDAPASARGTPPRHAGTPQAGGDTRTSAGGTPQEARPAEDPPAAARPAPIQPRRVAPSPRPVNALSLLLGALLDRLRRLLGGNRGR